jgi:prepilin-type N-terminal cleavage/methylation domain-containing protein/prepilin-type processing-associated H-X9-DG protein
MKERNRRQGKAAFTLIELLVVVAVIALLIAILLPSLESARESARAARCGTAQKGFGTGLAVYFTEYGGWFPGINTTGIAARVAGRLPTSEGKELCRKSSTPIQSYDWITPILRYETDLGSNRAERLKTILRDFGCPSQAAMTIDRPYQPEKSPDQEDFPEELWKSLTPVSFMMPIHFQLWGRGYAGSEVASWTSGTGRLVKLMTDCPPDYMTAKHEGRYQSRLDRIGSPARKVACADGFRFLAQGDDIDMDWSPNVNFVEAGINKFGSFVSNGAWWAGSEEYGVKNNTCNWNGTLVNPGPTNPDSQGRSMVWSYRHGTTSRAKVTQSVSDNDGEMNALFFDGHVARLNDRASREIEYWYPSGSKVTGGPGANGGLLDYENGYEVP